VRCPSPSLQWRVPYFSCCYKPSPLQTHLGKWCHTHLLWPAYLFTVHVQSAPPPLSGAQGVPPSMLHFFFISAACLLFRVFFFFSLGRGQSVQRAMLICPREYHMPLICSPGDLRLPSWLGAGVWQCRSPPGFSV
jgi:hypothetical protein